jgi:hypothetical protein
MKMALRTEIDVIKGGFNNWSPHGQDDEEDENYETDETEQKDCDQAPRMDQGGRSSTQNIGQAEGRRRKDRQDLEAYAWRDNGKGAYFGRLIEYATLTYICWSDQAGLLVGSG